MFKKKKAKKKACDQQSRDSVGLCCAILLGYYLTPSHWRKLGINVCEMYRTQVFT